jgi:hypothetical protein
MAHVIGIFLPLRVNSLPLATIYEVKIPLRKWKKSLLQRTPAQMTWANVMIIAISPQTNPTYRKITFFLTTSSTAVFIQF